MKLVNTDILKHPMNWIIILLMLIIAGAAGHLILTYIGVEPKTGEDTISNGQTQQ